MLDLLTSLAANAGRYVGCGINHEGERFTGSLDVQPLIGGTAVMLHYTAVREDGVQVHTESTLLGRTMEGKLCLWPVMQELPMILPHVALQEPAALPEGTVGAVFASGPREARHQFREEITLILLPGGGLRYAHAWGLAGGEFGERSSCETQRCDA